MSPTFRPGRVLTWIFRAPSRLYDWHLGRLLGRRFLRLTHTGRKSGRRYRTVLEVIGTERATGTAMVIAGFGTTSDWYRNLEAGGPAEVETGGRRFPAGHRTLPVEEAIGVFAAYERRNRLIMPIVRRILGKLLGRPYDGSDAARRGLAEELPIVALFPRLSDSGREADSGQEPRSIGSTEGSTASASVDAESSSSRGVGGS